MLNNVIIEYNSKFEYKVKKFLVDICVIEFGFDSWKNELENQNICEYKRDGGNFWIAIDNDENIIGTIALKNLGDNKGYLKSMYVDSNYRGSKIAKNLMDTLLDYAISNQYKSIELGTYTCLERAVAFYKKNKFQLKEQDGDILIFERKI